MCISLKLSGAGVKSQYAVSVLESYLFCKRAYLDTVYDVVILYILLSPCMEYGDVQDDCQHDIHQYSSCHDYQSLPCRTRAELPWLGRSGQTLLVQGLVYHAGYLAESTERDAAYAELSVTFFRLELQYGGWEEEVEFFHPYPEHPGRDVVSELVDQHQQRQRQDYLYDLEYYVHYCLFMSLRAKSLTVLSVSSTAFRSGSLT